MLTAIGLFAGVIFYFGTVLNSRIDGVGQKIDVLTQTMHAEFQQIHGRLERQDAEFKAHMIYYHSIRD
jgi:hypothetical protein